MSRSLRSKCSRSPTYFVHVFLELLSSYRFFSHIPSALAFSPVFFNSQNYLSSKLSFRYEKVLHQLIESIAFSFNFNSHIMYYLEIFCVVFILLVIFLICYNLFENLIVIFIFLIITFLLRDNLTND